MNDTSERESLASQANYSEIMKMILNQNTNLDN